MWGISNPNPPLGINLQINLRFREIYSPKKIQWVMNKMISLPFPPTRIPLLILLNKLFTSFHQTIFTSKSALAHMGYPTTNLPKQRKQNHHIMETYIPWTNIYPHLHVLKSPLKQTVHHPQGRVAHSYNIL